MISQVKTVINSDAANYVVAHILDIDNRSSRRMFSRTQRIDFPLQCKRTIVGNDHVQNEHVTISATIRLDIDRRGSAQRLNDKPNIVCELFRTGMERSNAAAC